MGYYLTHLELSMIAILLIGLFGCQFEPGPVPSAMVACGAIYIALHEFGRALYLEWEKRRFKFDVKCIEAMPKTDKPKAEKPRCYIYDLKEDDWWKEQKTNIS